MRCTQLSRINHLATWHDRAYGERYQQGVTPDDITVIVVDVLCDAAGADRPAARPFGRWASAGKKSAVEFVGAEAGNVGEEPQAPACSVGGCFGSLFAPRAGGRRRAAGATG